MHERGLSTTGGAAVSDFDDIVEELRTAYTDEGIRIWLNSRNRNLDRQRPIDLLTSGEFDRVLREAERVGGCCA